MGEREPWEAVRQRLLLAVRQELAATQENLGRSSALKVMPVGAASELVQHTGPVTAVFSVDLRRRTLRPEQLDEAFLATAADAPTRFPLEGVLVCKPAEVHVKVDAAATGAGPLRLFIVADPLALLRGLHEALASATDLGRGTELALALLGGPPQQPSASAVAGLNDGQRRALGQSLAPGVNVILGPPGTGKTQLLAAFLAQVVTAGRSALLVSNTNVAVDEALLRTDGLLGGAAIGALVRAGVPSLEALAAHEHLMLDKAVRSSSVKLAQRLAELDAQIAAAVLGERSLLTAAEDAAQTLADLPGVDELAGLRARREQADELAGLVVQVDALDGSVAALEGQLARLDRTCRPAFERLGEMERSEAARAQLVAVRTGQERAARLLADAQLQVDRLGSALAAAETAVEDAKRLGWWSRMDALPSASRRAKVAAAELEQALAVAASLVDQAGLEPDARLADLAQLAGRFSPAQVASARAEAGPGLAARADVTGQLGRVRAERDAVQAGLAKVLPQAPFTSAQRLALAAAELADYAGLAAAVAAGRKLEDGGPDRRGQALAERKQVLDDIARQHPAMIGACSVLATTTAAFASTAAMAPAREREWDYVVVDEASACLYPYLAYAATRARVGLTVVGDPLQNGPISAAVNRGGSRQVSRALSEDVFALLRVSPREGDRAGVVMLDVQYRFGEPVAQLANRFGYAGRLRTGTKPGPDPAPTFAGLGSAAILLVDVSGLPDDFHLVRCPPGASKKGSWLAGTAAAVELAGRAPTGASLGVVAAYAEQAALTAEALERRQLPGECGTAHRYQGREFDLVVFDTSEPVGHRGWSYAASFEASGWARAGARLCNVAMTRARSQVAVVVDMRAVTSARSGFLAHLGSMVGSDGVQVVDLAPLLAAGPDRGRSLFGVPAGPGLDGQSAPVWALRRAAEQAGRSWPGTPAGTPAGAVFLNEATMYEQLPQVLAGARESLELWSAFVARGRLASVLPLLASAVARGVMVTVHCKPSKEVRGGHTNGPELLALMRAAGVTVVEQFGTHEKALLVDRHDGYYGSLNLLSHAGATSELMIHLAGQAQAQAFRAAIAPRAARRAPRVGSPYGAVGV